MAGMTIEYNLHSTQELVKETLSNSGEWQSIDDLVSVCGEAGCWEVDFSRRAISNAKKKRIRNVISKMKDKDGFPLFPSIDNR